MIQTFAKGVFLGFSLVIPLGPQNIFIFQRATLQQHFRAVLPVVLVSALCDAFLVIASITGANFLDKVSYLKESLMLIGIGFLFYIGYTIWKSANNQDTTTPDTALSLNKQILYTLSVSLLNPHAIMDTFFVIGALTADLSKLDKKIFAAGCIFVDMLWFFSIAALGFYLKSFKNSSKIRAIANRLSACIIFVIAIDLVFKFIKLTRS